MQIYKITNKLNGRIYIGKDTKDDSNYYGSGRIIKSALSKYGVNNFTKEIIDQCYSASHLDFMECYWIQKFPECKVENGGYNIAKGGQGGGHPCTEHTRKLMSKLVKGSNNSQFGKLGKDNLNSVPLFQVDMNTGSVVKEWDSVIDVERQLSIGHENVSKACKNLRKTAGGFIWIYVKDYSEAVVQSKIIAVRSKSNDPTPKAVVQIDIDSDVVIREWKSSSEVYKELKISNSNILSVCKGHRETAGGFKWRYKDK